jgi:predicted flap endonuclease-1-like 5' DNA nuclease
MPEFTVIHIALLLTMVLVGGLAGWIVRGNRSQQEKAAINSGWQDQMEAQRIEHQRLTRQNKSLMDQVSQFQASNQDAKKRAKELSEAARQAYERRDELQREIKDVRSDLETVLSQRDKLRSDIAHQDSEKADSEEKDEKIFQLSRELESWHQRLPPLIERYRVRNEQAEQLEAELAEARRQIEELHTANDEDQTQIEAVQDPDALTSGLGASNDPSDADESATDPDAGSSLTAYDGGDGHPLREDLKQIKGVGPAIERTLNEMGIYRLQQIADMTEYDIDRVAERLKGFHSRIYRENWIGQARELQDRNRRA